MRLNVSRAESVPAFVCTCVGSGTFLHFLRADGASLNVGQYGELSACTHVSAHIKSLACACICWFVSGAGGDIIMCLPVSKAEHECACPSASGDSVMILPHVSVCIGS
jgi:hypothetical protein